MKPTKVLQEIRKMRFEETYEGWNEGRLTQAEAARILGVSAIRDRPRFPAQLPAKNRMEFFISAKTYAGHYTCQSRKFWYCNGKSVMVFLMNAMALCRSSRFLPVTRTVSP